MGQCAGKPSKKKAERSSAYQSSKDMSKDDHHKKETTIVAAAGAPDPTNTAEIQSTTTPLLQQQQQFQLLHLFPCLSQRYEYTIPPDVPSRLDFIVSTAVTEILCTYRTDATKLEQILHECSLESTAAIDAIHRSSKQLKTHYSNRIVPSSGESDSLSESVRSLIEEYLHLYTNHQNQICSLTAENLKQLLYYSLLILHISITVLHFKAHEIIWWEHPHPLHPVDFIVSALQTIFSLPQKEPNQREIIKEVVIDYIGYLYSRILPPDEEHQSQHPQHSVTTRTYYGENLDDYETENEHNASACLNYSIDMLIKPHPSSFLY